MGGNVSQVEREARLRSAAIDQSLHQDAEESVNTIKILVLGAMRSGKSTLVKQMRITYGDGYIVDELKCYKSTIHRNLLAAMVSIVRAMNKLRIPLSDQSNEEHISAVLAFPLEPECQIPPDLKESLKMIIHDRGFQQCFHRAYEYQLNENAPYYLKEMERILGPEYTPNEEDVLQSYVRTTDIVETSFRVDRLIYRLVDVGGTHAERRNLNQFDDVKAVIFVAALNGYDMTSFEDDYTNQLEESLNLFQAICNNRILVKTAIILFLNKMDLFEEKIMRSLRHLRFYFPEYTGPDRNVEAAAKFIENQFLVRNVNKLRVIHSQFITATDTHVNNMTFVHKYVLESIIREHLEAASHLF